MGLFSLATLAGELTSVKPEMLFSWLSCSIARSHGLRTNACGLVAGGRERQHESRIT